MYSSGIPNSEAAKTAGSPASSRRSVKLQVAFATLSALALAWLLAASPAKAAPGDPGSCLSPVSDEFNGSTLDAKWGIVRDVPGLRSVSDGNLNMMWNGNVDMNATNASASNILLQDAPNVPWTLTAKIDTSEAKQQSNQVGLILWQNEGSGANNFAKVVYNARTNSGELHWAERYQTVNSSSSSLGNNNTGLTAGQPDLVYIRLVSDGAVNPTITPSYSIDGGLTYMQILEPFTISRATYPTIRAGILLARGENNTTGTARFDWFRLCVPSLDTVGPTVDHEITPGSPDGPDGEYYLGPVSVELNADDGAEGTGVQSIEYRVNGAGIWTTYSGEAAVFSELGKYDVEYRATDAGGNVSSVGSVGFTIDEPPVIPPDPALLSATTLKLAPKKVKPGAQARVVISLTNLGESPASNVKVCAAGAKKKAKIVGTKCIDIGQLDVAGVYGNTRAFWALVPKKFKGKKVKVTITVTADDAATVTKTLTLNVKQPKKKKKK